MEKLQKLCKGKQVADVWASAEVKTTTTALRTRLQGMVKTWANEDGKRNIPVYISLKPKMKLNGLYFEKLQGGGAITLFPIKALPFQPIVDVLTEKQLEETLRHEYAHHLTGTAHGNVFQDNLKGMAKR